MQSTITARRLLCSERAIEWPLLTVSDGSIVAIESLTPEESADVPATYCFPEATLAPSFVDVHVHGAAGHDVMEGTAAAVDVIGAALARHGVGAYLPTTVTSSRDETLYALAGLAREIKRVKRDAPAMAVPLGIHLEGPFLSEAKRGVHTAALLEAPSLPLFDRMWEASEGKILLMTIAPELGGALELIAHATARGVRCSLGHSDATVAEARAGQAAGAVSATHTFNAMSGLGHRNPGLAAFVLDDEEIYAEIVADGVHVDPLIVRLYRKCKREDRLLLVSDGISATGMPNGRYILGRMEVDVFEGRCTSGSTIAGSVLTLDRGVTNFMAFSGADLPTAVNAASRNPARLVGQEAAWGSLELGNQANLNVLTPAGQIVATFLRGQLGDA